MYNLTEFSLKQLRALNRSVADSIRDSVEKVNFVEVNMKDNTEMKRKIIESHSYDLEDLRLWSVQIHNAIDIVKQRETTNAN